MRALINRIRKLFSKPGYYEADIIIVDAASFWRSNNKLTGEKP